MDPSGAPFLIGASQQKFRRTAMRNNFNDRDSRSALTIISFCVFAVTLASVLFIGSGAVQIVRAELPSGWVVGGLPIR
jgi:hypothetical protein